MQPWLRFDKYQRLGRFPSEILASFLAWPRFRSSWRCFYYYQLTPVFLSLTRISLFVWSRPWFRSVATTGLSENAARSVNLSTSYRQWRRTREISNDTSLRSWSAVNPMFRNAPWELRGENECRSLVPRREVVSFVFRRSRFFRALSRFIFTPQTWADFRRQEVEKFNRVFFGNKRRLAIITDAH